VAQALTNEELAAKATGLWRRIKYDTTTITYLGNGWFNQLDRSLMGAGVNWGRKQSPGFRYRRKEIEASIIRLEQRIEREAREAIEKTEREARATKAASIKRQMLSEALTQYIENQAELWADEYPPGVRDMLDAAQNMLDEIDMPQDETNRPLAAIFKGKPLPEER